MKTNKHIFYIPSYTVHWCVKGIFERDNYKDVVQSDINSALKAKAIQAEAEANGWHHTWIEPYKTVCASKKSKNDA